jgi:hypothetical protein
LFEPQNLTTKFWTQSTGYGGSLSIFGGGIIGINVARQLNKRQFSDAIVTIIDEGKLMWNAVPSNGFVFEGGDNPCIF